MKISAMTIDALAKIIAGENDKSPYRSGPQLIEFFNNFGFEDIYKKDFPSRMQFTKDKLNLLNGKDGLKGAIESAVDPLNFIDDVDFKHEEAHAYLNKFLSRDGLTLIPKQNTIHGSSSITLVAQSLNIKLPAARYVLKRINNNNLVSVEKANQLSHEFILEQIQDCQQKLAEERYSGAITNARSLVEGIMQEIILKYDNTPVDYKGDMSKMYKSIKKHMNLSSHHDMDQTLKQLLSGLESIISGLAGLSNKMGDRHARKYKPVRHHAELAINAAFLFSEFLLSSYEHQKESNDE